MDVQAFNDWRERHRGLYDAVQQAPESAALGSVTTAAIPQIDPSLYADFRAMVRQHYHALSQGGLPDGAVSYGARRGAGR